MDPEPRYLLGARQLEAELERCVACAAKPCRDACPAHCSPADFIMAARGGEPSDLARSAAMILAANPLGGVCGVVCPDSHCMAACARTALDEPIRIPAVQATIIQRARDLGMPPVPEPRAPSGSRVAVVGGGPAGLAATAVLAQLGHAVDLFDAGDRLGGMATLVPPFRLDPGVLDADLAFVTSLGAVTIHSGTPVPDPSELDDWNAVVVATGLDRPRALRICGEDLAVTALDYLRKPDRHPMAGRHVAVVGGGAVAVDCALTAGAAGAATVELVTLESLAELPLTRVERTALLEAGVEVSGRTRVTTIVPGPDGLRGIHTVRVQLPEGATFHPAAVEDIAGAEQARPDIDVVIVAIGAAAGFAVTPSARMVVAGDLENGPTTVVEAVAAGKNAAQSVHATLTGNAAEAPVRRTKSTVRLAGYRALPVPLDCEFFGMPLASPLLLSAAPPSDGYEQMRRAYEAGWAGGVMKTAFAGVPIHIPSRYMVTFDPLTWGNCDNVSGHDLERVCREVERLRREFPDRLTMASTGGPVTGHDEADREVWLANTRRLEAAGACGIEYSLSCPQGGDGTHGDIVSQSAELTATIVRWVLAGGDPAVPKLFKLTPAVTSILPIVTAVRAVLAEHPAARAGITLANTFPTLAFRSNGGDTWDEGIVMGMSGRAVAPISNLTLAKAAGLGVAISGNGGVMGWRDAANFLALGARTVQLCSVVMKYGYEIVDELHSGLSHGLAARGLASVAELIGRALPDPITAFDALPTDKRISAADHELCARCGSCGRCPYLAITPDADGYPVTDPARCVGCSFCAQGCFTGALTMRPRTTAEAAALVEA